MCISLRKLNFKKGYQGDSWIKPGGEMNGCGKLQQILTYGNRRITGLLKKLSSYFVHLLLKVLLYYVQSMEDLHF